MAGKATAFGLASAVHIRRWWPPYWYKLKIYAEEAKSPDPSVSAQCELDSLINTRPLTIRMAASIRVGVTASPKTRMPTMNAPTARRPP